MTDDPVFPDLAGAVVVITGGASGIGAALTEGFLRQGARVAFLDLLDGAPFCDRMEEATGRRPIGLRCDLTDLDALRDAMARAEAGQGPARVLVNNAANDQRHATLSVDGAFFDAAIAVNLKAAFFAAQAVLPGMRAMGRGSIINFSSIAYMMGNAGYPVYAAAKAAITGLTRSLAREFGAEGIRVNALAPGWVLTERQKALWATPEALAAHVARQCLPSALEPADIVPGCLFLASEASRAMTGQALIIDGGVVVSG